MRTISDVYPSKWLNHADLQGKAVRVAISEAIVEDVRQRDGTTQPKVVLSFDGKQKRLILNKTQATDLSRILGTDVFDSWPGNTVVLSHAKTRNGYDTIAIQAAPSEDNPFA
jgi:hypothetical protein